MLNINTTNDGGKMNVELDGRLDTTTAPMLESELKGKARKTPQNLFLIFKILNTSHLQVCEFFLQHKNNE